MLLAWEDLREAICNHLGGRNPYNLRSALLNLLAEPVPMNINVPELLGVLSVEKLNSLLVIAAKLDYECPRGLKLAIRPRISDTGRSRQNH
jgi:hypothetical protein